MCKGVARGEAEVQGKVQGGRCGPRGQWDAFDYWDGVAGTEAAG